MKTQNRWIIIFSSFLANIIIGAAYAWSVFQPRLIETFGFSTPETNLAFTIALGLVPIAMIIAAKLRPILGAKRIILIGSLLFSSGFFLTSFSNGNLLMLYLTYGVLGGLGTGFINGSTLPNAIKWFPDKRGLASGIVAGGYGGGAILFAPLFSLSIEAFGVMETFAIFGVLFGIVLLVACQFIVTAPDGYQPENWAPTETVVQNSQNNLSIRQMFSRPLLYILWLLFTISCITGLMVIAHGGHIAEVRLYTTSQLAAVSVTFLSFSNAGGRIFWGYLSDKIGRYKSLVCMYLISILMFGILLLTQQFWVFIIATMGIGLCYGGSFGVFPSLTAEHFGTDNLELKYGFMLTSFGVAAYIGPAIAAWLFERTNTHDFAFVIAIFMSLFALVISLRLMAAPTKKLYK